MIGRAALVAVGAVAIWYGVRKASLMHIENHLDSMPGDTGDVDIMARTAWGEARGEGTEGMHAICNVIMNRVARKSWYGRTVRAVCLKPWQFSCWNLGDPNRDLVENVTPDNPQFAEALHLARLAVDGALPDITNGADHYEALSKANEPSWTSAYPKVADVGAHEFYRSR